MLGYFEYYTKDSHREMEKMFVRKSDLEIVTQRSGDFTPCEAYPVYFYVQWGIVGKALS